jgi:hypothetical protein
MKEDSKKKIDVLVEKQKVKTQELTDKHKHEEEVRIQFLDESEHKITNIVRPKMEEIIDYIQPDYKCEIVEHTESENIRVIDLDISLGEEFKPVIPKSDLHISFSFNPLHQKVFLFSNIIHPDPIKPSIVHPSFDIEDINSDMVEEKIIELFEKHFEPVLSHIQN